MAGFRGSSFPQRGFSIRQHSRTARHRPVILSPGGAPGCAHCTPLSCEASMELLVQNLLNGLTIGAFYALVALGYTMVYGVLKLINFAHGDIFIWGPISAGLQSLS